MMINKALLLWLSFLLSHVAFANDNEQALLRSVMPTACHFSGDFVQEKQIQDLPIPLISRGRFFFSCDMGVIWQTQTPFADSLIYGNYFNYRIVDGDIKKLTSLVHYGMSKIMLRMLKGDVNYFAKSFSVALLSDDELLLSPESKFMKKAINSIELQKIQSNDSLSLLVSIQDKNQQRTKITIDNLLEYELETKTAARKQCEAEYSNQKVVCEILRFPSHFDK